MSEEYTSTSVECVSLDESFLFMTSDGRHLHSELNGILAALNAKFSAVDTAKDMIMIKGYNNESHREAVSKYRMFMNPCAIGNPYPVTVRVKGIPITTYAFTALGVYKDKMYKIKTMMSGDIIKIIGIKEILFTNVKIPKDIILYAIRNANPNFSFKISKRSISSFLTGIGYRENTAFNNAILNYTNTRHTDCIATMVGTAIQNIIEFKEVNKK